MPDAQQKLTAAGLIAAEEQRIKSFVDFERHRNEAIAEINGMRMALRILDANGLLVTPEHDAQVLHDAADRLLAELEDNPLLRGLIGINGGAQAMRDYFISSLRADEP